MPRFADPHVESLWRRRLRQQPQSGLSIQQFCQREGVSTTSFHLWKRRLALQAACAISPARTAAFLPVIMPPGHESSPPASTTLVTIQLPSGGQILLPLTATVALVCAVVQTVMRSSVTREGPSC